ncbi:hypothetical protein [Kibdelosporangium aridum]|uniref:Uncharacterized protein n=1 Tax=Kibdelosporangium aridum TaxID=2030 RepID=A0A1W2DHK9_KIBAR|nr:hypothetical protein [Kibdelosporangium aridum]SMC96582.1 hypothetical protein SAMN05661093_03320 [Kibdelosporangium aridum]
MSLGWPSRQPVGWEDGVGRLFGHAVRPCHVDLRIRSPAMVGLGIDARNKQKAELDKAKGAKN